MGIKPTELNGELFYTVREFAIKTSRGEQSVRVLISKGNRIRKLRAKYFGGKPFVYAEEVHEFPFTVSGKNSDIFHYDDAGRIFVEDPITDGMEATVTNT